MERAIAHGVRPTLVGLEAGALLAGATILLALEERGVHAGLALLGADPLAEPLSRALRARSLPWEITAATGLAAIEAPILIGAGGVLDGLPSLLREAGDHARVALVGLGSEACAGVDPARTAAHLAGFLAEGSLIDRTLLRPHDAVARGWLELVEDVHHEVGPARQLPIVDAIRAALFGRHGLVAVDLAARERPALVGLETASIVWLDPARMSGRAPAQRE